MKHETKILQKLKQLDLFSESERTIAQLFSSDPQKYVNYSIREIANETFTSPSTVVRFSKKLCKEGFTQFRILLASELEFYRTISYNSENKLLSERMADLNTIVNTVEKCMTESISLTKDLLNYNQIVKIIDLIMQSKKIHIFGCGVSYQVAKDFYFKLFRIGKIVEIHKEYTNQYVQAINAKNDECALILSVSGETTFMISIAQVLVKNGVPIITLTNKKDCSLVKFSDFPVLITAFESYKQVGSISSFCSMQYVLNILYFAIFNLDYNKNKEIMLKSNLD